MKLMIATIATTLTLAGAASAMTGNASLIDDPRSAALGATGQSVSGDRVKVDIEDVFEPRARALNSADSVYVSVFSTDTPRDVQVDAQR